MTLMPVSNSSTDVDWSSYGGDSRWMGHLSAVMTGPISSTGSPMTFRMRPSVSGPTGIEIGAPRSTAFMPRTRPSAGFIEMHRTRFSKSFIYLHGMTLDYQETLMQQGFVFVNPQASKS